VWGAPPDGVCSSLADAALRVSCSPFPATRALMAVVALLMLALIAALLTRTRTGLVVRAALTHPEMVNSLGHDLPRLYMLLFGAGTALAALAGVVGGSTYLTEPAMAASMGAMVFVVVGGEVVVVAEVRRRWRGALWCRSRPAADAAGRPLLLCRLLCWSFACLCAACFAFRCCLSCPVSLCLCCCAARCPAAAACAFAAAASAAACFCCCVCFVVPVRCAVSSVVVVCVSSSVGLSHRRRRDGTGSRCEGRARRSRESRGG
jgi:hypothetical protein